MYNSFNDFFEAQTPPIHLKQIVNQNILILPTARITKRNLPNTLVQKIKQKHVDLNDSVTIAHFNATVIGAVTYTNFSELVQLIKAADFVYGADSLPIHLSNLLQKPHYILYPESVTNQFFTPFALANNSYANFNSFA